MTPPQRKRVSTTAWFAFGLSGAPLAVDKSRACLRATGWYSARIIRCRITEIIPPKKRAKGRGK